MSKIGTTRFPFINLEKSLDRAKALFDADSRGRAMRVSDAFHFWGYSEKSSGGFQTISALKMYDLIDDQGANDDRKVNLTDAALRYFLDERDDEREKLLRHFALAPKLVNHLWSEWGGRPPADNLARSELKLDYGLQEQSARSFLGIYKDNLDFAKLGNQGTVSAQDEPQEDEASGPDTPPPPPPPPAFEHGATLMDGERELTSGLLSKTAKFRLIVSGQVSAKEIDRLIAKLQLDKEILAETDAAEDAAPSPEDTILS